MHERADDHRHSSSRRHGPLQRDGRSIPTTSLQGNEERNSLDSPNSRVKNIFEKKTFDKKSFKIKTWIQKVFFLTNKEKDILFTSNLNFFFTVD